MPSPPLRTDRWRLHHQARLEFTSATSLIVTCAGRRWRLQGLGSAATRWLAGLGTWPRPAPLPADQQTARLAGWLRQQGLATVSSPTTLLVSRGYSHLRSPLAARLPVTHRRLPQPDDLAVFGGLVVLEDRGVDHAAVWALRRAGVAHIVVQLGPGLARVGSFLDEHGCAGCVVLDSPGLGPAPQSDESVPLWMADWAAIQVVLAAHRWACGVDLTPGWWWLDGRGRSEHSPVPAHPGCGVGAGAADPRLVA
ncbi:hypothetical protein ACPCG0_02235 [Propionibacteriaceae bacterium Y1923]|uniref:hypothetical protein n=1 Tax=Aestuariimicrobium sp. Y1814 TaxID=3418742 RepID=UPI003C1CABF2